MTATAEIVTSEVRGALLIPNAALRFKPPSTAKKATAFGMSMGPQRRERTKQARVWKGTRQSVYILGADGEPQAVAIIAGASNGAMTSVTSAELKAGDRIITGSLAARP
jgi:HlyD family secretion protein